MTWHTLFQAPTVSELTHRLRLENRRAQTPNIAVCIRVVDRKIVFRGGSVEFPVIVSESVDRSKKLTYKNRAAMSGQKNDCTIIADRKMVLREHVGHIVLARRSVYRDKPLTQTNWETTSGQKMSHRLQELVLFKVHKILIIQHNWSQHFFFPFFQAATEIHFTHKKYEFLYLFISK